MCLISPPPLDSLDPRVAHVRCAVQHCLGVFLMKNEAARLCCSVFLFLMKNEATAKQARSSL
jgi:hypothetical protein